ncbi:glycosyltransferase [Pyrococcus kukulkanii]|uniref:Capsular biosynthesis protein n=1 Tax=Pyrococcus kukulkanii TaxID=1609559 RepID=A0A127B8E6_9EURY|nr:glycosyltransferase [Pyrococcus kukulkanii]AMM53548.1 capsular biosynthesis protein [Pyrococcus kukulkanii]
MSEKVVLMFLANDFYTDPRVKQEAMSLIKAGFKVHVLAWDREGKFESLNLRDKLFVKNLKFLSGKSFGKIRYALAALLLQVYEVFYGIKLIRKYGKIIIHANDFNTLLGAYVLKSLFLKNVKLVYDSHELTPAVYEEWYSPILGEMTYALERKFVEKVDWIITISPPVERYFKLISDKPVTVIYNFPLRKIVPKADKIKIRSLLNLPREKTIVSFVGMLREDLALMELIQAAKILKEKGFNDKIYFVIVGYGPSKEKIWDYVKENKLENIVTLIPRVPREKALMYVKAADYSYVIFNVLGYNSLIGMPWKLFESFACETRVIVKDGTYAAGFVKKNNLGIVIRDVSPENLAKIFEELVEKNMSPMDSNWKSFTWEAQEMRLLEVYNRLLEGLK